MFDSLSGKLQNVFRNLRGLGKISEGNVSESLRDVRMALDTPITADESAWTPYDVMNIAKEGRIYFLLQNCFYEIFNI